MNIVDGHLKAKLAQSVSPVLNIDFSRFAAPPMTIENQDLASQFLKRLISMINDFNLKLDNENEVGLQLCNFCQKFTIYIQNIGYWNPSLIRFFGIDVDTKNPVKLIQHASQINILLIKLPKLKPSEPKNPIVFATWEEFENSKNEK